jgi:antitoxin VapB
MALNIRNPEASRLAAEVASLAGETKTDAVILALKERLQRLQHQLDSSPGRQLSLVNRLDQIALRCAARPILDHRSAEEICGYDALGLPS